LPLTFTQVMSSYFSFITFGISTGLTKTLYQEIQQQTLMCQNMAEHFYGKERILNSIENYIQTGREQYGNWCCSELEFLAIPNVNRRKMLFVVMIYLRTNGNSCSWYMSSCKFEGLRYDLLYLPVCCLRRRYGWIIHKSNAMLIYG